MDKDQFEDPLQIRELIQILEGQISIVGKSYRKLECNYSDEFLRSCRLKS